MHAAPSPLLHPDQTGLSPNQRMLAIALVIALHGLAAWALLRLVILPAPHEERVLFVDWVSAPERAVEPPKPTPPPPRPQTKAAPTPLIAAAPTPQAAPAQMVVAPDPAPPTPAETAPSPAPAPVAAAPAPQPRMVSISEIGLRVPARPEVPRLSIKLGEQGKVLIRILVDTQGKVAKADVYQSSGYERLDRAALRAVERAELNPYMEGGKPTQAWAIYPIEFKLE